MVSVCGLEALSTAVMRYDVLSAVRRIYCPAETLVKFCALLPSESTLVTVAEPFVTATEPDVIFATVGRTGAKALVQGNKKAQ